MAHIINHIIACKIEANVFIATNRNCKSKTHLESDSFKFWFPGQIRISNWSTVIEGAQFSFFQLEWLQSTDAVYALIPIVSRNYGANAWERRRNAQ